MTADMLDFSRQKWRLAVSILVAGMVLALVYHGWEGFVLKRGYPYDTFLFQPDARFSDFTDTILYVKTGAPYQLPGGQNNHFPADYLIFTAFAKLPAHLGAALFITAMMAGLLGLLLACFRFLFPRPLMCGLAVAPFLFSYPCLNGFDRGNSEILLAFLVGLSLFWYRQKKFGLSFFSLLLPICFKFYPVALLLLFVRRKLTGWVLLLPFAFALITWLALLTFKEPVGASLASFWGQLSDYNVRYNLGQDGINAAASAWNFTRIGVWAVRGLGLGDFNWPMPLSVTARALEFYYLVMVLLGIFLAFQVLLVEKSFARRAILLLIYLTVSVPGGANYKLMHVVTALVVLILIPQRRRFDRAVVALLAFAVIPKQEVLLPYFGISDSTAADCSIAVILNPICLLLAMALLVGAAYHEAWPLGWGQRLRKFGAVLRSPRVE